MKNDESPRDNELLVRWVSLAKETGLTETQQLGLAYFNSAIPTVLANVNQDESLILPLGQLIPDLGKSSSEGANFLTLYREIYLNAVFRDPEIKPIDLGKADDFFSVEANPYIEFGEGKRGLFLNSMLTLLLIHRIGTILENHKIPLQDAFRLGHNHMNFLLRSYSKTEVAQAVILSNIVPQYISGIIEIIPQPKSVSSREDLWIFSKIFYGTISGEFYDDQHFAGWLWYFHNTIFFKNEVDSMEIKAKWSLDDPEFESKMITEIMGKLPSFFKSNSRIGKQTASKRNNLETWEEFFPLLNRKVKEEYEIVSPCVSFNCRGEYCNYLAYKFIASVQTIFENIILKEE